ncbi:bifunctional metallophosphatase/5'-nucleotidase [Gracilibacillus massiliensis]|uniref:bifunctional metallophosphatase/5'-nucleotidase n=1 Tax=Gracilibacillus massiliensis TaxID=1564956 RepID=UPI00071C4727|nr:bifunctional UDP-sugar hydrolase/5'-nucleotidase [Gracilibacillus massiliensis]
MKLSICVTSDIHGYITPSNYRNGEEENMGLAKVASLVNKIRKNNETVLIDNGDFIQGSPFTYYFAKKATDQKNPMIKVANQLKYDLAVIGNHEFNYGMDFLQTAVSESDFPWLSANVVNKKDQEPFLGKPYVIKQIADMRIAVLGMTTHYIPNWEDPNHIKDLYFEDVCESTKKWVPLIHELEKPDLMVVSYHGGVERDPNTGEPTEELTGENQAYQICQEVEGIDLLITGHQHRFLTGEINGVQFVQAGNNGQAIAEIKIEYDKKIKSITPTLHYVDNETEADLHIIELIKEDEKQVQDFLDQTITTVEGDMEITDPMAVRLNGHPFIHYINQLQMKVAEVDISCTALFHDNSPGFPKQVTMRDIVSNYIYPNTLKVLKVSGHDIKAALEKAASYFQAEGGEIVVSPSFLTPKPQPYNYDMWQGIYYEIVVSNPIGERVITIDYQGKSMDMDQTYHVVMNNYRASGGGDYSMFKGKEVVKDIPLDMTEVIANDLLSREKLKAENEKHFRISLN